MAQATPLKLTFDTNSLIYLFGASADAPTSFEALAALMRYGLSNKVQIAATTRAEGDISNDRDAERRNEMLRFLSLLPIIGTVGRWEVSQWDAGDRFVDEGLARLHSEVRAIVFPGLTPGDRRYRNKLFDIDHLVGHKLNGRDIFVTDDTDIWRRQEELKRGPGIVVMRPDECVAYVDNIEQRRRPQSFLTDGINPKFHARTLEGHVRFNYSNNDHRFSLGEGHFYFETRWSKGSNTSIHAYRNPPSVDAIALAKGAQEIVDVRDAATYDFSSRARTPSVGQIVIWRNANGIYAATRIVAIADDSRGASADELTFDYVILADGGVDFARPKPK